MANTLQTQLVINADVQGTNEVNQLANSLGQVSDELNQATQPASATAQALGNVANSANNTHHSTTTLSQSIAQVNAGLAGTATPTTNASTAIGSLASTAGHLAHNTSHLTHSVGAVNSTLGATSSSAHTASASLGSLTHATNQSTTEVSRLDNAMGSVRSAFGGLQGLLATLGVGLGAAEIVQLADEFNNLEARVKLATNAGGDFNHAMASIKTIADSTAMPLTATADLFSKLTQSTKELGYSQSEVLDFTQTISQAMAVSGGDMASMEAGLTQLAQGLSAGALRGDELNSVLEQSPRLATALADGLGVTIGELKELGAEGKITAQAVGDALKSQADVIANEFAQMPATVSGSLTVLKNSLMGFIGELDNELQGASGLANFITQIADNINHIDPTVIEGLKNALDSTAIVAKTLYDSLAIVPNALGDVLGAIMGLEAGSGQISIIQGLMNGLALGTGAVADGFKALQIVITGVMATLQTKLANTADLLYKLTGFGGEFAKSISDSAKQTQDEFDKLAMGFESSLGKAMDSIAKGADGKLQEMASNARQKYEQMATDGKASTTELENAFKDYAHKAIKANNGVVDSTLKQELAQKGLQAVIDDTGKVTISAMETAKKAADGVDLSKHADSFKALGIDMSEFAGGLSSKANTALGAFNDLAKVADGNLEQLAMAYNGARGAIGDNAQGLNELDKALSQAVDGSLGLAQGVKALATEQQNAKNATTDQQKALQALGVEMNAINKGMSQSGQKMVDSLRVGITAIKETATNATALKTALQTAFDSAINSAKTVGDFKAIDTAIKEAGVSAQLSSTQMQALQQGLQGNAAASQAQAKAVSTAAAAQSTQTNATSANTQATSDNTQAKKENANASEQATNADNELASTQQKANAGTPLFVANIQNKVQALSSLGVETQKLGQVTSTMFASLSGRIYGTMGSLLQDMTAITQSVEGQIQAFKNISLEVDNYGKRLGSASVSVDDLSYAQSLLNRATNAGINGIQLMDQSRLDNLKAQIDSARTKLKSLADDAKNTADSLEGELARMQGNDKRAIEIENIKKLADLEAKLNQARQRNNTQEIRELERALALQRQINKTKLNELDKRQERQGQSQQNAHQATNPRSNSTQNNTARYTSVPSASDVAGAFGDAIDQARRGAVNDFAKQLMNEAKRIAR